MHASLLNFREPRAALCLALVALLHILALSYLQLHARKLWPVERPALALPSISLQLLPFVLESAAQQEAPSFTRRHETVFERSAAPMTAANSMELGVEAPPTQPSDATPSDTPASPLNLNLSKRDWADATARKLSGPLPTHMTPGAWQQFVRSLGPPEEIKEERLSINRVRIHTKHGCYELEQTATKRLDPFNWSPQPVTNCRY